MKDGSHLCFMDVCVFVMREAMNVSNYFSQGNISYILRSVMEYEFVYSSAAVSSSCLT